jgi:RNA polymerase sigma-70 factor (ECF subfamily)
MSVADIRSCGVKQAVTQDQEIRFSRSLSALLPNAKAFARSVLGSKQHNHSLYEDFAQEAMLKAWEHRHQFVPGSNMKAWLFAVVRNVIFSHYRRTWREIVTDNVIGENQADGTSNPEKQVMAREVLDRLQDLSGPQRAALMDVVWDGLSYREAAERRGVATGTVKSRVARARDLLADVTAMDELRAVRRLNVAPRLALAH